MYKFLEFLNCILSAMPKISQMHTVCKVWYKTLYITILLLPEYKIVSVRYNVLERLRSYLDIIHKKLELYVSKGIYW
jgi:hypothetical protein